MSLRPSNDRDSKGRSRSRNRSRDDRASSPPKASTSSKDKKKARFSELVDDEDEPSMPGAFESPLASPKYEIRSPSSAAPGLSALSNGLPPLSGRHGDSDDSDNDRYGSKKKRSSRRYNDDSPSPPSATAMPYFPIMPPPPENNKRQAPSTKSTPYPSAGPQYPVDGGMFAMPSADYGVLNSYDYAPPVAAAPSHRAHDSYGSREVRPPPMTAASYHEDDLPRHPPPPTRGYTFPTMPKAAETAIRDDGGREARKRSEPSRSSFTSPTTELRAPSGNSLAPRMNRLSVSGARSEGLSLGGGLPPPSPLLEAYKGTYQSISPMPSPSMRPIDIDDIPLLSPIDGLDSRPGSKDEEKPASKRRARIYDSEADAKAIWDALKHHHTRTEPLIKILPELTHDQMLELNTKYKNTYKKGGEKVDMAKHIKSETEGQFQKICFVTASGKWKSEAYWANFWYQSHATGRELLIESLMGRTNAEIREIKKAFRDKRYDNDLARCMKKELKPDKFRDAVMDVLEEQRQEETDSWPAEYKDKDVDILRRALLSKEGGESAILKVVVNRSDRHLRDVLKSYEGLYGTKFGNDALKKSPNLVGEVIAHILNGVINKPQRDMQLLHHAISDISTRNKSVELRHELLMSRLVRAHWDRLHLAKIKAEYKRYYKTSLENEIEEATKGDFGQFCVNLCET